MDMFSKAVTPRAGIIFWLILLLVLSGIISLGIGAVQIAPFDVLLALFDSSDALASRVVQELRLPRVLMALICGAFLAVSGTMLQAVVRNPLASPDLVGVGAGAGVFAVMTLIFFPTAPVWLPPLAAFVGAWLGFALVLLLAQQGGQVIPLRVALIGIAVSAALGALQQLILLRAPDDLSRALIFLVGSVYGANWSRVEGLLPWLGGLLVACLLAKKLDLLAFSDDVVCGLGMRLWLTRVICMSLAVALAAAAVTGAGLLGFVGLIAPHAARLLVGSKHAVLLPTSALLGAVLVICADALGRALIAPTEIPAGIFTTLIGAPYFLFLMWQQGRLR
jgi:ABC-type Fe3+-siderophore transport system permease subunit